MNSKILFAFLHSTGIVFQPEWKIYINFTFDIPSDSLAYILIAYILISIDISILIKYFPRQKNSLFLETCLYIKRYSDLSTKLNTFT